MSHLAHARRSRGWRPRAAPAREALSLWCRSEAAVENDFPCLHNWKCSSAEGFAVSNAHMEDRGFAMLIREGEGAKQSVVASGKLEFTARCFCTLCRM